MGAVGMKCARLASSRVSAESVSDSRGNHGHAKTSSSTPPEIFRARSCRRALSPRDGRVQPRGHVGDDELEVWPERVGEAQAR